MRLFAVILMGIIYITLFVILAYFVSLIAMKKFNKADKLFKYFVIHNFCSFMAVSWLLILINDSFNIYLTSNLNISLFSIFIGIFFIGIIGLDYFVYYHVKKTYQTPLERFGRRLLGMAVSVLFIAISYLFYLGVYDYYILSLIS